MEEQVRKKIETEIVFTAKNTIWAEMPLYEGLPLLRRDLCRIAGRFGVESADVFEIYMDYLDAQDDNADI